MPTNVIHLPIIARFTYLCKHYLKSIHKYFDQYLETIEELFDTSILSIKYPYKFSWLKSLSFSSWLIDRYRLVIFMFE